MLKGAISQRCYRAKGGSTMGWRLRVHQWWHLWALIRRVERLGSKNTNDKFLVRRRLNSDGPRDHCDVKRSASKGALSVVSVGAVVHNDQELFRAPTERAESCRKSRKLWKKYWNLQKRKNKRYKGLNRIENGQIVKITGNSFQSHPEYAQWMVLVS